MMNKRIKELGQEARSKVNDLYESMEVEPDSNLIDWFDERFEEQFAELIVKECAQVSEDDITDGDACCTNTADRIARQIKKHFGFE